jgi:hypothetical protein
MTLSSPLRFNNKDIKLTYYLTTLSSPTLPVATASNTMTDQLLLGQYHHCQNCKHLIIRNTYTTCSQMICSTCKLEFLKTGNIVSKYQVKSVISISLSTTNLFLYIDKLKTISFVLNISKSHPDLESLRNN